METLSSPRLRLVWGVLAAMICTVAGAVEAAALRAADIDGLRRIDGEPSILLLGAQFVKNAPDLEDQTVAHFDIASLQSPPPHAALVIPLTNIDPEGRDGVFDVHAFAGDGVVSIDEWSAGVLFHSFTGLQEPRMLRLDVTEILPRHSRKATVS